MVAALKERKAGAAGKRVTKLGLRVGLPKVAGKKDGEVLKRPNDERVP